VVASAMERGVDRFQVLAISALTGVLGLNACLWLTGDLGVWVQTPPPVLLQVIVAGVLGMAGLLSFTSALSMTTVASANALNSLQVGLAPLIAWLLVGEALNAAMAAGIVLVMGGVIGSGQQASADRRPGRELGSETWIDDERVASAWQRGNCGPCCRRCATP